MTDKEKIIKELKEALDSLDITNKYRLNLIRAIEYLQEESVSVWHDANEKPNFKEKGGIFVITSLNGEYIGSRFYNSSDISCTIGTYDKWAYIKDLLNLSNVEIKKPVSDELEKVVEEIVDPTVLNVYGVKEIANRLRRTMIVPVSDDLEEEINNYVKRNGYDGLDSIEEVKYIAKYFTKWQKEQMMAKAINAHCFGFQGAALFSFRLPASTYLVGSEVKVVVIKED